LEAVAVVVLAVWLVLLMVVSVVLGAVLGKMVQLLGPALAAKGSLVAVVTQVVAAVLLKQA
jgi:hypothetical protein